MLTKVNHDEISLEAKTIIDLELNQSKIVVVIPALNEEDGIGGVIDAIDNSLNQLNYSILVVDGPKTMERDRTSTIAMNKGAHAINQPGKGYGDALITGFNYARDHLSADILVMMDADMTYDPDDIHPLVEPIFEDYADLVIGNRFVGMEKGAMTRLNTVGNKIISYICKVFLGVKVSDTQCGLRVFSADLLDSMHLTNVGMPLATEMISEATFVGARIVERPITYKARIGETKLSPVRDGLRIFDTILALMRDTRPMSFFGGLGILLGVIGALLGFVVTFEWLTTGSVSRVPTTILSVLFILSAIQMVTIGLVADMIKGLRKRLSLSGM
jgi:dolichol-phosphate mannosyltransferase